MCKSEKREELLDNEHNAAAETRVEDHLEEKEGDEFYELEETFDEDTANAYELS